MVGISLRNYAEKTTTGASSIPFVNNNAGVVRSYNPVMIKGNNFESPSKLQTDAVYTTWENVNAGKSTGVPLTLLHLNDNHRKYRSLFRLKTAFDAITQKVTAAGSDLLKIHSGDFNVGNDGNKFSFQVELLNKLGINYSAIGNHEFDIGSAMVAARKLSRATFMLLAANMVIPANSGFDSLVKKGKIVSSVIHKTPNAEYGLIGISPPDIKKRTDKSVEFFGIDVLPIEETIKAVQAEIERLRNNGINKIILISHAGINADKRIAQETDGLDVILGGHSHVLLDPLEDQESIIYSNKTNEPVLVLQDGQNGQFCGVTDINFDAEGVIKTAIARQERATSFAISADMEMLEDEVLGKSPMIGVSSSHYKADDVKLRENPLANLVADSFRAHTGADVAIYPSPDIRGGIEKGLITERDIRDLLPFVDCTYVISLSGEDLIQALNNGARSYARADKRPGILQVSGIRYTISPDGEATDVMILDKNGQYQPVDIHKDYTVATRHALTEGREGYISLAKPTNVIETYYEDSASIVINYIKKNNFRPLVLRTEGRINVQAKSPLKKIPKAFQSAGNVNIDASVHSGVSLRSVPGGHILANSNSANIFSAFMTK